MNAADQMIMFLGNSTMSDEPPNPQDTFNAAGGLINTLGNAMEASIDTGSRYNNTEDGSDGNTTKVDSAVSIGTYVTVILGLSIKQFTFYLFILSL
jgi:hypothetical protein